MNHVSAAPTYQFSVEEFQKLGEAGIFGEDDRVELLNGDIIVMAPIEVRHLKAVRRLNNRLMEMYGRRCLVDAQNPVTIDGHSQPLPDILLLREEADDRDSAPIPEDVLLLVEVADTSLVYDQTGKRAAYARNGIAEYWILDLTRDVLHVFRDAEGGAYRTELTIRVGESIAPLAFADTPVPLSELLPRPARES
jgi:Uma2 family endonuclease